MMNLSFVFDTVNQNIKIKDQKQDNELMHIKSNAVKRIN
jgi:hypothetical protein